MKVRRQFVMTLAALAAMSGEAVAQEALPLIKDSEVADSEPKLAVDQLHERKVWIGNAEGQTMSADMLRLDLDSDDVALHPTSGYGTYIGYTKPAEFLAIREQTITAGALKSFVQHYVAQLSAADQQQVVVSRLTEADFDGDGATEVLIAAYTKRQEDPYAGRPGDVDALLVIEDANAAPRVTARFVNAYSGPARTIPVVGGIARNPMTGEWNFLVEQIQKYWGEGGPKISVTINGQKMEEPDPARTRVTITDTDVYRYANEAFVSVGKLNHLEQTFCEEPGCD